MHVAGHKDFIDGRLPLVPFLIVTMKISKIIETDPRTADGPDVTS
jgi:hypothetical protein